MLSLHSSSMVLVERLINCVVEGTLLALFVSLLFRFQAFRDSAMRFTVWLVTLFAILLLPFLGSIGAVKLVSASSAPHVEVSPEWLLYGLAAWLLISLFGLLRIYIGLLRLRGLRRRAREIGHSELPCEARSVLEEFSSARVARICVSDEITAPTAVGFLRPAVLMPEWALRELAGEELRSVLLHELGHLRRWDDWTNLLQKLLRAILFFHPAVWWIESRLCLEREMACDDLVLANTNDARGYAECLVSLAEKSALRRGAALAVAAVGRVRQMTLRLGRILDHNSRGRVPRVAMVSLSAVGLLAVAASARLPMLVILQERVPPASMSASTVDVVSSAAVKAQLTSAKAGDLQANVISAVMKISKISDKSHSPERRAIRSSQRAVADLKPKVIRASLSNESATTNAQHAWLLIVHTVPPDLPQVPEILLSEPFSATVVCGAESGTCTITSSGFVRFTIYRSSGAIPSEFVANVI